VGIPGEGEDSGVLAPLAHARFTPEKSTGVISLATPQRSAEPMSVITCIAEARIAVDTAAGVLHPPGRIHNHNHPERTRGFAPPARPPVTAAGRSPCAIPSTGRAKRGQALTIPVADADAYHESPAKATVKVVFAFTVKETTSLPLELTVPRSIIFLALPLGCA